MLSRPITTTCSLLLLSSILLVAGCGEKDSSPATRQAADDGQMSRGRPGTAGSPAPDLELERLDGGTLDLASLRGKVVLVDFWDTWCPPCRAAMPQLQELSEEYDDRLVLVGVGLGREGRDRVASFVAEHGLTFEMVMADPRFEVVEAFGGITNIPTTFLIGPDGVILQKWVGYNAKAVYESGVRRALAI